MLALDVVTGLWLAAGVELESQALIPNHSLRKAAEEWLAACNTGCKRQRPASALDEAASRASKSARCAVGSGGVNVEAGMDEELMATLRKHKLQGIAETLRVRGGVEAMEDLQLLDAEDVKELELAIVQRKRLLILLDEVHAQVLEL